MLSPLFRSLITMSIALAAAAPLAVAQSGEEESSPIREAGTPESRQSTVFVLSGSATYLSEADIDEDSGEVSVFRVGGKFSFRHAFSERFAIVGALGEEYSEYDFNDAANLFPGSTSDENPLDSTHETVLTLGFEYGIDEYWSAFGGGIVGLGFEQGADLGESLYGGGSLGFNYRFSETFSLGLGVGVLTRLEKDALVLPLVTARWQIKDDWLLETNGISGTLTWSLSDEFEVHGFARFSSRDFRLDDQNDYLPGGAFIDNRGLFGLGASWRPTGGVKLTLEAGLSAFQSFRFYDSDGNEISERDTDPQLMLRGGFEFVF